MDEQAAANVVALLGVSGSGKSVVARRLLEQHGFARFRFGDPMRDMLRAGFGLTEDDLDSDARSKPRTQFGGCTPHQMVKSLAHDWGRGSVHSDLWVNEWRRRIAGVQGFILSDDLQRANEAAAVRAVGGIVVRVTRPGFTPPNTGTLHRLANIIHDIELVNEGVPALIALADSFADRLTATLTGRAAA